MKRFLAPFLAFVVAFALTHATAGPIIMSTASSAPSGAAGGVLAGTYPDPTLGQLDQTVTIDNTAAASLLVRKNAAGASIFSVDSSGDLVTVHQGKLVVPEGGSAAHAITFNSTATGLSKATGASNGLVVFTSSATLPTYYAHSSGFFASSASALGWASTSNAVTGASDLLLRRQAARILALGGLADANAYTLYIQSTSTDASNYERLALTTTAGTGATLAVQTAGTGADDLSLNFSPAGTGTLQINGTPGVSGTCASVTVERGLVTGCTP